MTIPLSEGANEPAIERGADEVSLNGIAWEAD